MYILGISAFYHDSAACLIKDGKIIAAAQEERFTRKKHDQGFPSNSVKFCINFANIEAKDIQHVVFYEKPILKFERLLETYLAFAPRGFSSFAKSMPLWINNKLFQKSMITQNLNEILDKNIKWNERLLFSEHHLSHAASAFYPSPYDNAAILTLDGVGEWTTTSIAIGNRNKIKILKEINFPHSLGLLYSAFTYYLGFKVNSGEYKIMGLGPYGKPIYADLIYKKLILVKEDGSFQLNMNYFNYPTGLTMTNKKFNDLFGGPPRKPETKLTQREMDLAASIQKVIEEILVLIAKNISKETGEKNLCLAGGVALNCVANSTILRLKIFDNVWVQPAAGDAGGAVGAALAVWHLYYNKERKVYPKRCAMNGTYLGPKFSNDKIESELNTCGAVFKKLNNDELIEKVSTALVEQRAIGWMQGRMEFGPRALGARSIIADPRSNIMQKQLNLKIKYRESFRPFAPSILEEDVKEWFNCDIDSPFMSFVFEVKKNKILKNKEEIKERNLYEINISNIPLSTIPAVTHVDYTARVQTVNSNTNLLYHALISKFKKKTGCPLIINTSFNIRGEPIVCSPQDAFRCFMGTELDMLVIENYLLFKEDQKKVNNDYKKNYLID